jgi:hypothetical protein
MALTTKHGLTIGLFVLACVFGTAFCYFVDRINASRNFNEALRKALYDEAGRNSSLYGRFASAYALQQQGRFEEALKAYAKIATTNDPEFKKAVMFNLANLYLQHAIEVSQNEGADLAVSLIELAKATYRDLLRIDSLNWDARYNLECALALLPDVDMEETDEEFNPEHSPHAAGSVETRQELP